MSGNAMASRGETIENPLIGHEFRYFGDRFRILESARETGDGSTRANYFAAPGARVPEHVHRDQEESFRVVSGRLGVRVGRRESILEAGQSAVGPPGIPHAWWNPSSEEEAHFVARLCPGMDVEILLETLLGLSRDGKTAGSMLPRNPLQLAVLAHGAGNWSYVTAVPRPLRKVLFAPVRLLAFVGRMLGYRTRYPEYSGPERTADWEREAKRSVPVAGPVIVGAAIFALALLRQRRRRRKTSG